MELYNNIKKFRLQRGLTQDQLAKLTGYTDRSSIAKIERGLVDISQSKLELFATVLHVTAGELIGNAPASPSPTLSASETQLIDNYRQLNEEGQEIIQTTAAGLVASGRYIKDDTSGVVDEEEVS